MRLGVPYKGSKSRIAERIIADLPSADTFVDLFAGGCAVTHAAMLSGKYNNYIINDIDGRGVRLFRDAIEGKYDTIPDKWISREDFKKNRALPTAEQDPYIALCWSFGTNMKDYLYAETIEEWKHAFHEAVFHNDLTLWRDMGFMAPECNIKDVTERRLFYASVIRERERERDEQRERLQHLERGAAYRLEHQERAGTHFRGRLHELEHAERRPREPRTRKASNAFFSFCSYEDVDVPDGSVIYCDIPYRNTQTGGYNKIDYEAFYDWCERQTQPVFISEYDMPSDRFKVYAEYDLTQLSVNTGAGKKIKERLFVPIACDIPKQGQLSLFG